MISPGSVRRVIFLFLTSHLQNAGFAGLTWFCLLSVVIVPEGVFSIALVPVVKHVASRAENKDTTSQSSQAAAPTTSNKRYATGMSSETSGARPVFFGIRWNARPRYAVLYFPCDESSLCIIIV